jgi:argininosuccinate lyase
VKPGDAEGAHKLWGARFREGPAPELEAVNRSIGVDFRLWPFDIRLSQAWARALVGARVLSVAECEQIVSGLSAVGERIRAGTPIAAGDEDIHTMIDRLLHDVAGDVASRLHTGRSRNDQVATATRMWTIDAIARVDGMVRDLQRTILEQADALIDAVMPAYTHMQRAQPVSGAHWMLSHFWPLARDRRRLANAEQSASVLPLGSGAVAGSAFQVSRAQLQSALGFHEVSQNSIDAVGDRDFIADAVFSLATLGVHLSRLAEDLILFGSSEFSFVRFGDAYSTGSSMMPQKRNPDALELARGASARMIGDLTSILVTLKGLPSGYNKDLQDDKRVLFDAVDATQLVVPAVAGTIRTITFQRDHMARAVSSTMMATDLADYLVRRRVTFRDAHAVVGSLVREAEEKKCELSALPFAAFKAAHTAFEPDVLDELTPASSLGHREIDGGTGPASVRRQVEAARASMMAPS